MNDRKKTLRPAEYISYSVGLFGYAMLTGFVGSYQQIFYTEVLRLEPGLLITLFLVARIWDGVNDPIEGFIIDRTKTRWGKFRPYIMFMSGPLAICAILMFTPFSFGTAGKMFVVYATYLLYGTLCSITDSSAKGLACVATLDGNERAKLISYGNILRAIGNSAPLVVLLVVELILKNILNTGTAPQQQSLVITAWVSAAGGGLLFIVMFFGNKERIVPEDGPKISTRDCFKLLKTNRPLQLIVLSNFLGFGRGLAVGVQGYIAIYMLGSAGKMLQLGLPTAVGTMAGMLLVPLLIKKFDVKKTFIWFSLFGSAMLAVLYFLGYERIMGNKFDLVFYIFLFLVGLRFGNTNITPNLMLADVIDYHEYKTGLRTEGVTYAVVGLFDKISGALGGALLNGLLIAIQFAKPLADPLTGESIQQVQSAATMNGIFALFTIIPAAFGVISILPILFYKLVGPIKLEVSEVLAKKKSIA